MNKNIVALILAILTALGTPVVVDEVINGTPTPDAVLTAPASCEVGELVRLSYTASKVEWKLPGTDYEVADERAWISFRKPGTYDITVSGVVGTEVQLETWSIQVGGNTPVPEPTPEPDKPSFDLTEKVAAWCREAGTSADAARQLGDNFIDAASTADTVEDLMLKVAASNRASDQTNAQDVLVKIQVWMIGSLTGEGFVEHQCAFSEIGQGFLNYASERATN